MTPATTKPPRVIVDGKFLRLGEAKFTVKGVTYGPFAPGPGGHQFPVPEQVLKDFGLIRELGANVLRLYHVPPLWFLDLALEHGLRLLIDVPWNKMHCFLDSEERREKARSAVREAASACAGHPAVFGLSVVNEIPPDVVRWYGPDRVGEFIDELVDDVKSIAPDCLCTFANFPPTEYLRARSVDFVCFNVYLHHQKPFESYLARLQMLADTKPLLLGEYGIDTLREGESFKVESLGWQIETTFRAGLAGTIVFSFTDDWFQDGRQVENWQFGLTTRERERRPSFQAVKEKFAIAPHFPLPRAPMVSVVVACYNGARTLHACLHSLERLNYPNYEVILVDDGSTDTTPQITAQFKTVRCVRQENMGLSVARNTGIAAARGEIVAFTDADCRADEDWLFYLIGDLLNSRFAAIGGHNFLPPEDSAIAAAVMSSPGGPAHVMLTDRLAEHIPGCNMAFYKWALEEIGGFDPIFRQAGDDVDVCWRLQQNGHRIGFSPAGFVWHYRRSTVADYLSQQRGYGAAEALLVRKHPENFSALGGSIWHGRIYGSANISLGFRAPIIYHGIFGSGFFQSIYRPSHSMLFLLTSLEYHILVTVPLMIIGFSFRSLWPLGVANLLLSLGVCVAAAMHAEFPRGKERRWSRALVALLFHWQPIVRGWARYRERLSLRHAPPALSPQLDALSLDVNAEDPAEIEYWAEAGNPHSRVDFLNAVIRQLGQQGWLSRTDAGWNNYDVEIFTNRWTRMQLVTVLEQHKKGARLIRCRLRPAGSLLAACSVGALAAVALIFLGLMEHSVGYWIFFILMMVCLLLFLQQEQRKMQHLLAAFLDQIARELRLMKLPPAKAKGKPAAGADGGGAKPPPAGIMPSGV